MGIIEELMMKEHAVLSSLLNQVEDAIRNYFEKAQPLFNKFKWSLEKHFFVEEKAIFVLLDKVRGEMQISDIFDLMQEHGVILEQVKNVEEAFLDGQVPEIENLKKAIEKHAEFEDKVFYPKLDENLNPQQKQEIIDRIKEVIRE